MKFSALLLTAAPFALLGPIAPALAAPASDDNRGQAPLETFSTGVAKGRDRLDSATSTSSLRADAIEQTSAHSLAEVLRSIPGLRVDPSNGEGAGNYTIRGLPLASTGSKFMQLQEDGLPALEFGDIFQASSDMFLRTDFNIAQIEALRGGSASTFASNSPGGVINLISKTGDTPGGAVQVTEGLNYGEHRLDFDYGEKLSDTLRYHVGGFYRKGEGVRRTGFEAYNGGQIKFNITKQFANGYIRLYAKVLDDRTPGYLPQPLAVSGTNANPVYTLIPGYDARRDSILSRNISTLTTLDENNHLIQYDIHQGQVIHSKAIGLEGQIEVAGWTISDKARYAANSGNIVFSAPFVMFPGNLAGFIFGGPGAHFTYASGPNTGTVIANPATLNGNGIVSLTGLLSQKLNNADNFTNDLRANRVFSVSGGTLTLTAGVYKAIQKLDATFSIQTLLTDVAGNGNTSLLNLTAASGANVTQGGTLFYATPSHTNHTHTNVKYDITAPYASLNFHVGKVSIGGSLRLDTGRVRGILYGAELGEGRPATMAYDINGDGVITGPEAAVGALPLDRPGRVNYNYHYVSYSAGINVRLASSLAVFGRYSRGARAGADRILFAGLFDNNTGKPLDPSSAYNPVRQAELGLKFRTNNVTLNLTGFYAKANDLNTQVVSNSDSTVTIQQIIRVYTAKGLELESAVRHGPFSLNAGATYTKAKINSDLYNPSMIGHVPRTQPDLIFNLSPVYNRDSVTLGATVFTTTDSYSQDSNQLKIPGYTVVNGFLEIRPTKRLELAVRVNNLFNKLAITGVQQPTMPGTGLALANTLSGRTIATSLRLAL